MSEQTRQFIKGIGYVLGPLSLLGWVAFIIQMLTDSKFNLIYYILGKM